MSAAQDYRVGRRLAGRSGAVALSTPDRTVTFGGLDDRAGRVAAGLLAAGLVPTDRVLTLLPNGPEIFELLIGCARAGLVLVPMNWRLAPDELAGVAADAGAAALFVHASFDGVAAPLAAACRPPALHVRVGGAGPAGYEHWISRQPPAAAAARSAAAADVVLQVYTSGTTAAPKGVLLTHGNLAAKVPQAARLWGLGPGSVSLLATPLFHIGGLSWGLIGLHAGARTLLGGRTGPAWPRCCAASGSPTRSWSPPCCRTCARRPMARGSRIWTRSCSAPPRCLSGPTGPPSRCSAAP